MFFIAATSPSPHKSQGACFRIALPSKGKDAFGSNFHKFSQMEARSTAHRLPALAASSLTNTAPFWTRPFCAVAVLRDARASSGEVGLRTAEKRVAQHLASKPEDAFAIPQAEAFHVQMLRSSVLQMACQFVPRWIWWSETLQRIIAWFRANRTLAHT